MQAGILNNTKVSIQEQSQSIKSYDFLCRQKKI